VEFRILGPLEVTRGDRPVVLAGPSQRALLAVLLLHANEILSKDLLIDWLWGEEPPGSGVTALQVRVSQLRKALGADAGRLETKPPGYLLRVGPSELDLDHFSRLVAEAAAADPVAAAEQLREALGLWRGPALADLAYEPFAQEAIRRMDELHLEVVERRIEADLALGRHADLITELEELVAKHPLQERLRAQLILALYRSGRQADALDVYRQTRRVLHEVLGLEPSQTLKELERAILRQDRSLDLVTLPAPERSILVAVRTDEVDSLLALAEPLARRPPKELILTRLVSQTDDLAAGAAALVTHRTRLLAAGIVARTAALVSRTPAEDIVRLAAEQDVDLVLLDGHSELLADRVLASVLMKAPCDVAVQVGAVTRSGAVLVPFVGADHDWAAVELAAWLAWALDAPLRLAGPREGVAGRGASRLLANASIAVQRTLGVEAEPLLLEPGKAALLAAADASALVVVGLSDRWHKHGLGEMRAALAATAGPPVVFVRRGLRPGGLASPEGVTRFTWSLKG
jgi:DNA-binding SARP family transcriptional activator